MTVRVTVATATEGARAAGLRAAVADRNRVVLPRLDGPGAVVAEVLIEAAPRYRFSPDSYCRWFAGRDLEHVKMKARRWGRDRILGPWLRPQVNDQACVAGSWVSTARFSVTRVTVDGTELAADDITDIRLVEDRGS